MADLFVFVATTIAISISQVAMVTAEPGFGPSMYPCDPKFDLIGSPMAEGATLSIDGNPTAYQPSTMYHGELP